MDKKSTNIKSLQIRLLEQSFRYQSSHLGSAFSSLPIIAEIFHEMKEEDRFVLSNGHAAGALYVILEAFRKMDSDKYFSEMGDHPKREPKNGIDCSTGSLGMGITVAVGMAIAKPNNRIFCLVSDGECAEGSVWEALRFARRLNLCNLKVYFSLNGWSGYDSVETETLATELKAIYPAAIIKFSSNFPFDSLGLQAHYHKMNKEDYEQAKEKICEANL